jgi:hypothetical protein
MFTLIAWFKANLDKAIKKKIQKKVFLAVRKRDRLWNSHTLYGYRQLAQLMRYEIDQREKSISEKQTQISDYKKQHARDKKAIKKLEDVILENRQITKLRSVTAEQCLQTFLKEVYWPLKTPETRMNNVADAFNRKKPSVVRLMRLQAGAN